MAAKKDVAQPHTSEFSPVPTSAHPGPAPTESSTDPEDEKTKDPTVCERKWLKRQDILVWLIGMIYMALLVTALYLLGIWRKWDSFNPHHHFSVNTSVERFLPVPVDKDPLLKNKNSSTVGVLLLVDEWYYWKLKPSLITLTSRAVVWLGYCLHQLLVWLCLYKKQVARIKSDPKDEIKSSTKATKHNWLMLGLNAFFCSIHLLQTHLTYDGLAQEVSYTCPEAAILMLLVLLILLGYSDRGVVFGFRPVVKSEKIFLAERSSTCFIRKNHGYLFAWIAVFVFWYHPLENTPAHALGCAYTWLILLQGSLTYMDFHKNRAWRLLLESWVIIYTGVLFYQVDSPESNSTNLWPQAVFGYGVVFVLTWIFLLPIWSKLHYSFRLFPAIIYVIIIITSYSKIPDRQGKKWTRMPEIVYMPLLIYGLSGFTAILIRILLTVGKLACSRVVECSNSLENRTNNNSTTATAPPFKPIAYSRPASKIARVLYVLLMLTCFTSILIISVTFEQVTSSVLNSSWMTVLLTVIYIILGIVGSMALRDLLAVRRQQEEMNSAYSMSNALLFVVNPAYEVFF